MITPESAALAVSVEEFHVLSALAGLTAPTALARHVPQTLTDEVFEAVAHGLLARGALIGRDAGDGLEVARVPAQFLGIMSETEHELNAWAATPDGSSELCALVIGPGTMLVAPRDGVLSLTLASVESSRQAIHDLLALDPSATAQGDTIELDADALEQARLALDAGDGAAAVTLLGPEAVELVQAHRATCGIASQRAGEDPEAQAAMTWFDCGDLGLYEVDDGQSQPGIVTLTPLAASGVVAAVDRVLAAPDVPVP